MNKSMSKSQPVKTRLTHSCQLPGRGDVALKFGENIIVLGIIPFPKTQNDVKLLFSAAC